MSAKVCTDRLLKSKAVRTAAGGGGDGVGGALTKGAGAEAQELPPNPHSWLRGCFSP